MPLRPFEFEDQSWFPDWLRDYQTEYLAFVYQFFSLYRPAEGLLASEWGNSTGRLVDLCSGAGFHVLTSTKAFQQKNISFTLSDKFPNRKAVSRVTEILNAEYLLSPIDVLTDPFPNAGLYTMFNAFHHFNAEEKILLIGKLNGKKLVVIEPLQPNLLVLLKIVLVTTVGLFILTPFIQPFSWKRLFLTYVLPIGILVTLWDGMASVLRAVSRRDMKNLAENAAKKGISVRFGYLKGTFARLTYVIIK